MKLIFFLYGYSVVLQLVIEKTFLLSLKCFGDHIRKLDDCLILGLFLHSLCYFINLLLIFMIVLQYLSYCRLMISDEAR